MIPEAPTSPVQAGSGVVIGKIVPRPGGTPQPDQTLIDVYIPPPDDGRTRGPGRKPPARVPRSLLILLVSLLVIALLAIVVLVALRKPALTGCG